MTEFVASPTMEEFMLSDKYVRVLAGPIGGGKSVCCAHELMRWATMQKPNVDNIRKTRFLIVRNTADQLKSTTLKTIVDWFPPEVYGHYSKTDKTLTYHLKLPDDTIVHTEWMLIALDTPDDVRKALSLEATGLWGNESRELHPEVVDGLLMRVNRFPSKKDGGITRAGAIFDTNMPDEDTWWEKKFTTPPRNWSVHTQPSAVLKLENWIDKYRKDPPESETMQDIDGEWYATDPASDNYEHLERSYYPNTLEGKTADFIRVYLKCEFGRSLGGLPVYEQTFSYERHIAKGKLHALPSDEYPLIIGMDFGRTPCAVICQQTPRGGLNVLSEVTSENMGIQKFLRSKLKPHLFEHYPGMKYMVAPDPSGFYKTQLNEITPCDIVHEEGFSTAEPPTNKTGMRIEAVESVLSQSSDTYPRLQIDRSCVTLIQGFRGKYKWKTNRQGELQNTKEPDKTHPWSDVHDSLQYAILVIENGLVMGKRLGRPRKREVQHKRASGWT